MKDISIKVKERGKKDEKIAEVFIEGDFTISYAEKVKDRLLDEKRGELAISLCAEALSIGEGVGAEVESGGQAS